MKNNNKEKRKLRNRKKLKKVNNNRYRISINKSLNKIIEWNEKVKKNNYAKVCFHQIKDYINDQ